MTNYDALKAERENKAGYSRRLAAETREAIRLAVLQVTHLADDLGYAWALRIVNIGKPSEAYQVRVYVGPEKTTRRGDGH